MLATAIITTTKTYALSAYKPNIIFLYIKTSSSKKIKFQIMNMLLK